MRDIKIYTFRDGSGNQIYSDNSGNLDLYTAHAIHGRLNKIVVTSGDHGNGSIFLLISGTAEPVLTKTAFSGTNPSIYYPRVNIQTNAGDALPGPSGNVWEVYALNNHLHLVGSGFGDTKYVSGVRIFYD